MTKTHQTAPSVPGSRSVWQDDLDLINQAAQAAGTIALSFFRKNVDVFWKNGGNSPVTAADFAANDEIARILRPARPLYGWLSEESVDDGKRLKAECQFIIDPIDGTRAFMNGLDTWCVSIAVVTAGRPVAGVLYAPAFGETFLATADGMVSKNGRPVHTASCDETCKMRVAGVEEMFNRLPKPVAEQIERQKNVLSLAWRVAMVADGKLDASLVKENAHDWDLAAADLILQNAGGQIFDSHGEPLRYNRPRPRHGILCAASEATVGRLMPAFVGGP